MTPTNSSPLTIRPAYADDQLALNKLAALDSAEAVPDSPLLVAEVEGELRVALSLRDGAVIADPFVPTAAVVKLLRAHAATQAAHKARVNGTVHPWRRGLQGLVGWLRPRSA